MATSPTAMSPMRPRRRKAASASCSSAAPPRCRSRTPSTMARSTAPVDRVIPQYRRMAAAIHAHGAICTVQLTHGGRRERWDDVNWLPAFAPSALRELVHKSFPAEMEDHDIRRIVRDYAAAVRRARDGDLDGVEISTQAATLIEQFWSPAMNLRTDGYGGSLRQSDALRPRGSRGLPRGGGRRLPDRHPHAGRRDDEGRPEPRRLHRDRASSTPAPASSISSASSAATAVDYKATAQDLADDVGALGALSQARGRDQGRDRPPGAARYPHHRCRDRRSCREGGSMSTWSA